MNKEVGLNTKETISIYSGLKDTHVSFMDIFELRSRIYTSRPTISLSNVIVKFPI